MILPAARKRQVARTASLPAPTGGWNARDAVADMAPEDAIQMDNYFPGTASVDLRNGSSRFATITGVTSPVETLITHSSGGTNKFLAAANGAVYDVTAGGAISGSLASGFASNRWQDVYIGGYTLLFNGTDTPQKFDGSAITANTITGVTPTSLISANLFGQRVFMIQKNTLSVWYLGLSAISGAASQLDFSAYCKKGGVMVAMGSWSRDGGSGMFDYAVFVTSMGEVLVFKGTDPSNASTWALQGVFTIGAPVGNRPLLKVGSDLVVICEDGFVPLSKVLPLGEVGEAAAAISDKIRDAVSAATSAYGGNFGWQPLLYPRGNWVLFNVPVVENSQQHQYVLNALNNSWGRFTGMNTASWGLFKENIYFGGNKGTISRADVGAADDNGSPTTAAVAIQGDVRTSFQYFPPRSRLKHFKMVRPVMLTNGPVNVSLSVSVDYGDITPGTITTPPLTGAIWDQATWNVTPWSSGPIVRKSWTAVSANGYSASLHMRTQTNGLSISLNSIDWLFEPGGVM